jgi:hypothetical protein
LDLQRGRCVQTHGATSRDSRDLLQNASHE